MLAPTMAATALLILVSASGAAKAGSGFGDLSLQDMIEIKKIRQISIKVLCSGFIRIVLKL